jgi:tRNA G18 (ribose-2'-O)-methylase SpoU
VQVIRIQDGGDTRLAPYAGVREPKRLSDAGLLIAEGRFVVGRLLEAGRVEFLSLLLNEAAFQRLEPMLDRVSFDRPVYVVSPPVIQAATGYDLHRGCLGLAVRPPAHAVDALLASSRLVVVLERVVDPDNVGSVFRNAEAFGADAVLLSPGCADPLYRKALRTSSGAALIVPFASAAPWPDALDRVRTAGFTLAAMTPAADATPIGSFVTALSPEDRVAVLLGSEGDGLTTDATNRAHARIRISMSAAVDSLNIATASGIALHRLSERRHEL